MPRECHRRGLPAAAHTINEVHGSQKLIPLRRNNESSNGRRWTAARLILGGVATVLLLIGFSLWLMTRSWFIVWQVEPVLQAKLGGNVTIQSARYLGNGWVAFDDVLLTAPDMQGPAAEVMRINRARIEVSLTSLLRLSPVIRDVEFENVHIRISENAAVAGALNVLALQPDFSGGGDARTQPPNVRLAKATLEVGRHNDAGGFVPRGSLSVEGVLTAYANEREKFTFKLHEIDSRGEDVAEGLSIRGEWDTRDNAHHATLRGFALDDATFEMLPELAQVWWERMALEGRLAEVTLRYDPGAPYEVNFDIHDVAITLPVNVDGVWSRFEGGEARPIETQPRMWVERGSIRATPQELEFIDLVGFIGSSDVAEAVSRVPYHVDLRMTAPSPVDFDDPETWINESFAACAVEMTASIDEFTVESPRTDAATTEPVAIDLPHAVTRVLERFNLERWTLTAEVKVERAAAVRDAAGALVTSPLRTFGTAQISDAAGAYFKFPYPLDDVRADLRFDESDVIVQSLTATGLGGAPITMNGRIAPPTTRHPEVELKLTARGARVDETLRAAMQNKHERVFEALMPADAFASLSAAELMQDERRLGDLQQELAQRRSELELAQRDAAGATDPSAAESSIAAYERRIAQLERLIDLGPFELGGTVDLDLSITRDLGPDMPTLTFGTIAIGQVGVLYDKFPYPFTITGGQIEWLNDRVRIMPDESGDGLPVVTYGGGVGQVHGEIGFEKIDGVRQTDIALDLSIEGDEFGPAVVAAIPGRPAGGDAGAADDDWHPGTRLSRAGRVVEALTASGTADYTGRIRRSEDDGLSFRFDAAVSDGRLMPTSAFPETIGINGVLWPLGYAVSNVRGQIVVTDESFEIASLTGDSRHGDISISGMIGYGNGRRDVTIDAGLHGLPIGRHLFDVIPADKHDNADALWQRYQPEGTFDAWLSYSDDDAALSNLIAEGETDRNVQLSVRPRDMQIMLEGEPVHVLGVGGDVDLSEPAVIALNDLEMHMHAGGRDDGALVVSGSVVPNEQLILDVSGSWKLGQFESPLVVEVMRQSGSDQLLQDYFDLHVSGLFDAEFAYRTEPAPDEEPFRFGLKPKSVALTRQGKLAAATLDEGSLIVFEPHRATIHLLSGRHSGGQFGISGVVRSKDKIEADLSIDYRGRLLAEPMRAFLPLAVQDGMDAIILTEGAPTEVIDATVTLRELVDLNLDRAWASSFDGIVRLNDAAILAGMNLSAINGTMPIRASVTPGYPPTFHTELRLNRIRAKGRLATDVTGEIELTDQGTTLEIRNVHGIMHGGTVAVSGSQELQGDFIYDFEASMTGVALNAFMSDSAHDPSWSDVPEEHRPKPENVSRQNQPAGLLYASLTLSGKRDLPESRRGIGTIRMIGGKLVAVPVALQLLQVVQLTAPVAGGFDFANVRFFLDGASAVLERIVFESTSDGTALMSLEGSGTLDLDSMNIAARFRSRGGVAILSDLIGGIGDQMMAIDVTGPLRDPKAKVVALPGVTSADDGR